MLSEGELTNRIKKYYTEKNNLEQWKIELKIFRVYLLLAYNLRLAVYSDFWPFVRPSLGKYSDPANFNGQLLKLKTFLNSPGTQNVTKLTLRGNGETVVISNLELLSAVLTSLKNETKQLRPLVLKEPPKNRLESYGKSYTERFISPFYLFLTNDVFSKNSNNTDRSAFIVDILESGFCDGLWEFNHTDLQKGKASFKSGQPLQDYFIHHFKRSEYLNQQKSKKTP